MADKFKLLVKDYSWPQVRQKSKKIMLSGLVRANCNYKVKKYGRYDNMQIKG
jgi:hypothetical protein